MSPETSATPSAKEGNHILGWVFGSIFLFMSLLFLGSSLISAFMMFILGLLVLPPGRKEMERRSKQKISDPAAFVTGVILVIVAIAAFPKQQAASTDTTQNTNQEVTAPVVKEEVPKPEAIFDLEALYGKNINEIRNVLGETTNEDLKNPTDLQIQMGFTEWDNTFEKDGHELLVTYNVSDGSVIDFFLGTTSGTSKNVDDLKYLLNINDSKHYTIEPVRALKDNSSYTGIKAVPVN